MRQWLVPAHWSLVLTAASTDPADLLRRPVHISTDDDDLDTIDIGDLAIPETQRSTARIR